MPRRTATIIASTVVLVVLLLASAMLPVPYAQMGPGPTVNTLGKHGGDQVLKISGHPTYRASGHLNMTTVQVTSKDYRMNLFQAVQGWLADDVDVVPKRVLYPENLSSQQIDQENQDEFQDSQESAKVAALRHLGIKVGTRVIVKSVFKDEPADGRLHPGDGIRGVDGRRVRKVADVSALVRKHKPGQTVDFTVVPEGTKSGSRSGAEKHVRIRTAKDPRTGRAVVGIEPGATHTFPFDITIKLADVGGPSAGLMFSLGLVDRLTRGDLTGGRFVAGTGTIADDGKVGEIGGIQMKTIAARRAGARYFLTPAGNCAAAASSKPDGLTLLRVKTLDDALGALKQIRGGHAGAARHC